MPVFLEFDSINYLRHGLWYLEQTKALEKDNPYLCEKCMQGHFVVKDKQRNSTVFLQTWNLNKQYKRPIKIQKE